MPLDEETAWQIAVAAGSVGLFLVIAVLVTQVFSANGDLSPAGGFALVGTIAAFIVFMSGAGLWLERQDFEDESEG